jgi:uncharacterized membrane protein
VVEMLDIIAYVLLGLFLLMFPGFLFSLVLYPKLEGIDFWTRAGMSLGLGVMLLLYVGFFIAKPELKMLQLAPFVGVTFLLCAVLAVGAYLRGGSEVVRAYTKAVFKFLRKAKAPKAEKPSPTSPPKPEEQTKPKQEEQTPKQPPEKKGESE